MSKQSSINLICGPVGSGKSTYATQLGEQLDAVVFSMDEWMAKLFQPDIPEGTTVNSMTPEWFAERVDRCESMIYAVAEAVLRRGRSVILDLGFIRKARRKKAYDFATNLGIAYTLHYVNTEESVRRMRVDQRNRFGGSTYAFRVTPEMFDFAERMFEAPTSEELGNARIVSMAER